MKRVLILSLGFMVSGMAVALGAGPNHVRPDLPSMSEDRAKAENGCSYLLAAVASRTEKSFPKFEEWKVDCSRLEYVRCKEYLDSVAQLRPEVGDRFGLTCGQRGQGASVTIFALR